MEKYIPCKWKQKAGIAMLIADKIYFKTKALTSDKERHYKILKGLIQGTDITLVNTHALKQGNI